MGVINNVINGAKKFINAIKNTIKKIIKAVKFFISPIGTVVGWILLFIFIAILLVALTKVCVRALQNLFGVDWNYSTYSGDIAVIEDLYKSGYEAVIDAENFQDFKTYEYVVLMDAAEYLRNNEIETLAVTSETNQSRLAEYEGALDKLVKIGATSRSVKVESYYDINEEENGNNENVTRPLLVYEFQLSSLNDITSLDEDESIESSDTESLIKAGKLIGSLEPYVYIIRDDITFSYWFYNEGDQPKVIEYSMELNAYNSTLKLGMEFSKHLNRRLDGKSLYLFPDGTYPEVPYYSDKTENVIYKIPLRTILGRYLPRAELLQAWTMLKQEIDMTSENGKDVVDELITSMKGVYNEICLEKEAGVETVEKTNPSGEVYKYSDANTNYGTFATFKTAGIEHTKYGINGFTPMGAGDATSVTLVKDFVSAVHITGSIRVTYGTSDFEQNTITLTPKDIAKYAHSFTYGSYLPAGGGNSETGWLPPSSVTQLESGFYAEGKKEGDIASLRAEILAGLRKKYPGASISGNFLKYEPIFKVEDIDIDNKLNIDHVRMPVLLVDSATTWARKITFQFDLVQNRFKQDDKNYIIPSCVSSMGLEKFDISLKDEKTYRGKAYRDIFARMKEKDVINVLLQLEYSGIEGQNDCYEYMRDVYKLLETSKEYSKEHPDTENKYRNIHENTYTYVYIPDTVYKYDDTQTQKIYWLNLFAAQKGDDAITKEELETVKTKDNELTWQVVEYEKYPECNQNGEIKVYALSPFGSPYLRTYYQTVLDTKGGIISPTDELGGNFGDGHTGSDWGGRSRIKRMLSQISNVNYEQNESDIYDVEDISNVAQKVVTYEMTRLSEIYGEAEARKKIRTELREQVKNNPIVAVAPGKVIVVAYTAREGFYVKIQHDDIENTQTLYMHLKRWPLVNEGDYVGAGTILGYEGCTGRSFGSHLHYQVQCTRGGHLPPYAYTYPTFTPFYNEEKASEEGFNLHSEYMSLIRTSSLVDSTPKNIVTGEDFTNQHPTRPLVNDVKYLIQKQGEMERDVIVSGDLYWKEDFDGDYVKYLEGNAIYDLNTKEVYFNKDLELEEGYLDIPPELYSTVYGDIYVKTDMPGSLPPLTREELVHILKSWLPARYSQDKVDWLFKNVFTDETIDAIIESQDTYNISPVFMLAVGTLEQQLGLSNTKLAKSPACNIFSIKGTLNGRRRISKARFILE